MGETTHRRWSLVASRQAAVLLASEIRELPPVTNRKKKYEAVSISQPYLRRLYRGRPDSKIVTRKSTDET
jgi:hypothetical protein